MRMKSEEWRKKNEEGRGKLKSENGKLKVVSDGRWVLKLPLEGKWSALADRKGELTRVNIV